MIGLHGSYDQNGNENKAYLLIVDVRRYGKEIEDKYRREAQESDLNPDRLFERIYDQVPCAKIAGTKGAKGEKLNARTLHKAFRASNGDIVRIFGGLGLSADQEGEDVVAIERMIHSVEFIQ